jgi:NADH:ubiquinone oxidoreductase subunit K
MKPLSDLEPEEKVSNSLFNQNFLLLVAVILFVLALAGFYFRKRLVKEFIETNIHIITPGYAQVIPDQVKKNLII